jgi:tellurite resistance protein TerC
MVLLTGAAMLVLPGPGLLVIPLGLGLLAVEFVCVRRWLRNARKLWRTQK